MCAIPSPNKIIRSNKLITDGGEKVFDYNTVPESGIVYKIIEYANNDTHKSDNDSVDLDNIGANT